MILVNDYDKFAKLRQELISKGEKRSHRFLEKPMMKGMIPNLDGKKVLMLGCGTGEEGVYLQKFGAKELVGIDISHESIKIAKDTFPEFEFCVGDMHKLPFEDESFDLVYSSLAIHYSPTPDDVYSEINRVLKKGGQLLFSVGHPLRWANDRVLIDGAECSILGYQTKNEDGKVYGNYHSFALHNHQFPSGEILSFYVGSPSFHFGLLKDNGFIVEDFKECKCIEEAKDIDYNYYCKYSEFPQFMAFLATKK